MCVHGEGYGLETALEKEWWMGLCTRVRVHQCACAGPQAWLGGLCGGWCRGAGKADDWGLTQGVSRPQSRDCSLDSLMRGAGQRGVGPTLASCCLYKSSGNGVSPHHLSVAWGPWSGVCIFVTLFESCLPQH